MNASCSLRVRYCRKPRSLETVFHSARYAGWHDEAETCVTDTRTMTAEEYDAFVADFFCHHDWLTDRGGTNTRRQWLAIEVTAPGRRTLYINSEGYSYARYVGVAAEIDW